MSRRPVPARLLACLLLAALVLAVYLPVVRHRFINYDDDVYVYNNDRVRRGLTLDGAVWAFTSLRYAVNWHPLTWLSHMLDVELFGLEPGGHHLVNLAFHAASAILLLAFLGRAGLTPWADFMVAALFALHPLHVESVAWVAERKDVLSTFFWMATLLAYLGYVRRPGTGRYIRTALLLALGLMAKPMGVTLPAVMLLLDYWPLGRMAPPGSARRIALRTLGSRTLEKTPLLLLAAASGAVTLAAQKTAVAELTLVPLSARLAHVPGRYLWYVGKMLCPSGLAVFYPIETGVPAALATLSAWLVLGALTLLALSRARRGYPAVGWLWFLLTLAPVIGFVQVGAQSTGDRYAGIPLVGLFIAGVLGIRELASGRAWAGRSAAWGGAVAVAACALLSAVQVRYWKDSVTLFQRAVEVTENNWLAMNNLGAAYNEIERPAEALPLLLRSAALRPDYPVYGNLGLAYLKLGRYAAAAEAFRRVVWLKPDLAAGRFYLGVAMLYQGDRDGAREECRALERLDPAMAERLRGLF